MERYHGTSQGKAAYAERSLVFPASLAKSSPLTLSLAVGLIRAIFAVESILTVVSDVEHSRMGRVLAHAFY